MTNLPAAGVLPAMFYKIVVSMDARMDTAIAPMLTVTDMEIQETLSALTEALPTAMTIITI